MKLSSTQADVIELLRAKGTIYFQGNGLGWTAVNMAGQRWSVNRATIEALKRKGQVRESRSYGRLNLELAPAEVGT